MRISDAVFERLVPIIVVIIPALWLAYMNYLAWFHPKQFQNHMNQWIDHNRHFRAVLNESWYSLLTSEKFFRSMVFIGFLIALFTLVLMMGDPVDN